MPDTLPTDRVSGLAGGIHPDLAQQPCQRVPGGGRTAEAIALHEQVLAALERVLGPDHPDTLAPRNNLAIAYQAAGRTAEAIALHEQVLAALERVLGPDHPSTLQSRNNLANARRAVDGANGADDQDP